MFANPRVRPGSVRRQLKKASVRARRRATPVPTPLGLTCSHGGNLICIDSGPDKIFCSCVICKPGAKPSSHESDCIAYRPTQESKPVPPLGRLSAAPKKSREEWCPSGGELQCKDGYCTCRACVPSDTPGVIWDCIYYKPVQPDAPTMGPQLTAPNPVRNAARRQLKKAPTLTRARARGRGSLRKEAEKCRLPWGGTGKVHCYNVETGGVTRPECNCVPLRNNPNGFAVKQQSFSKMGARHFNPMLNPDPGDLICKGGGELKCTPQGGNKWKCTCERCTSSHGVKTCISYGPSTEESAPGGPHIAMPPPEHAPGSMLLYPEVGRVRPGFVRRQLRAKIRRQPSSALLFPNPGFAAGQQGFANMGPRHFNPGETPVLTLTIDNTALQAAQGVRVPGMTRSQRRVNRAAVRGGRVTTREHQPFVSKIYM